MSRVNNVSSPPRILLFSAISVGVAAAPVPFWAEILVFGTEFFVVVKSEVRGAFFVFFSHGRVQRKKEVRTFGYCRWLFGAAVLLSSEQHRLRAADAVVAFLRG